MPVVKVKNLNNEEVGDFELPDAVFDVPLNRALVYSAVNNYLANQRAGTVATKTRGNTSGSGRKLWKQKGTGRARIARIRSPLWRGGGEFPGPPAAGWSAIFSEEKRRGREFSVVSLRSPGGGCVCGC